MVEIKALNEVPLRLDVFLVRSLPDLGRRAARQLIARGAVRLNGLPAPKGSFVYPNDVVTVRDVRPLTSYPSTMDRAIDILYEDQALIAIDKPAGIPTHAHRAGEQGTAGDFLLARYPELASVGRTPLEAGLVHRLDTETSGVLIAARHVESYHQVRRMFSSHQVSKLYLALVAGDVSGHGIVTAPIAHAPHNPRRMQVCATPTQARALQARPAFTCYRPIRRLSGATLVAVKILTGLRHQIRVHLAFIGHPVLGDRLYAHRSGTGVSASRLFLHAVRVRFRHPHTNELLTIQAPLPEDFREAMEHLNPPMGPGVPSADSRRER